MTTQQESSIDNKNTENHDQSMECASLGFVWFLDDRNVVHDGKRMRHLKEFHLALAHSFPICEQNCIM